MFQVAFRWRMLACASSKMVQPAEPSSVGAIKNLLIRRSLGRIAATKQLASQLTFAGSNRVGFMEFGLGARAFQFGEVTGDDARQKRCGR